MAQRVESIIYGVDAAKRTLDINCRAEQRVDRIDNDAPTIKRWIATLPPNAVLGVEATNTFHLTVVELAHAAGLVVYVIDGYRLSKYRESIGGRAKTDPGDARLIARYVARERDQLRVFQPLPPRQRRLWRLLRRRAKVVEARKSLLQSLSDLGELKSSVRATAHQLQHLVALLEKRIRQLLGELGWAEDWQRVQQLFGVGELTAAALTAAFHRGEFASADAYVAFLGLDVRVRDSGKFKGKRKLTKQGDGECRRLLYNAAQAAARGDHLRPYYQRLLSRGFTRIQALVAVMRKLARIAFALLRDQSDYQPQPA